MAILGKSTKPNVCQFVFVAKSPSLMSAECTTPTLYCIMLSKRGSTQHNKRRDGGEFHFYSQQYLLCFLCCFVKMREGKNLYGVQYSIEVNT